MYDRGLSHRLSQRSRRAGLMIGISMVVTVAFCAVAFTVIYTALEGFTSDFVSSADSSAPDQDPEESSVAEELAEVPSFSGLDLDEVPEDTDEARPNSAASVPTPTPAPDPGEEEQAENEVDGEDGNGGEGDFNPDFQTSSVAINLRAGPSRADSIVDTLPPATPLEYLGEDAPTISSEDGSRWMMFRTEPSGENENGLEGWVREIDTIAFEP